MPIDLKPLVLAFVWLGAFAGPMFAAKSPAPPAPVAMKLNLGERDPLTFLRRSHAMYLRRPGKALARKFEALAESPITFFRGSAQLFYRDLASVPALKSSVVLPLQGDLHLENLGAYRTSDGEMAFDLDDFDEAVSGPYTWELARTATSIHLVARSLGLDATTADVLVKGYFSEYLARVKTLQLVRWSATTPLTSRFLTEPAAEAIAKAAKGTRANFLHTWTENGRLRTSKKVLAVPEATRDFMALSLGAYAAGRKEPASFFALKDLAERHAGVASQCRYRYVVLVEGPSTSPHDDLILEFKEEAPPAAIPYLTAPDAHPADRVRRAWVYFVPRPDPYLGTAPSGGAEFLVKELSPYRGEVEVSDLDDAADLKLYLNTVARVSARAHSLSGKQGALLADAGNATRLMARVGAFARAYADQVVADHAAFKQALASDGK